MHPDWEKLQAMVLQGRNRMQYANVGNKFS